MTFYKSINKKLEVLVKQQNNQKRSASTISIEEHTQLKERYQCVKQTNQQLSSAIKLLKSNQIRLDDEKSMLIQEKQDLRSQITDLEYVVEQKAVQINDLETIPCQRCQQNFGELRAMRSFVDASKSTLEELKQLDNQVLAKKYHQLETSIIHQTSFILENNETDLSREFNTTTSFDEKVVNSPVKLRQAISIDTVDEANVSAIRST